MDILAKTKKNIEELNQRFFLLLENFVPNYIRYLQDPNNTTIADEILHVTSVNNKIASDGFILKNSMDTAIQASQDKTKQLNDVMDKIKKDNKNLNQQIKILEETSLTSVGLFNEEIDWYRLQIKTIIILLIGFALCGKLFYDLQPSMKEIMVLVGIVLVIGIIEMIVIYSYTKIKNYNNDNVK